jgi:hypothetical protein
MIESGLYTSRFYAGCLSDRPTISHFSIRYSRFYCGVYQGVLSAREPKKALSVTRSSSSFWSKTHKLYASTSVLQSRPLPAADLALPSPTKCWAVLVLVRSVVVSVVALAQSERLQAQFYPETGSKDISWF